VPKTELKPEEKAGKESLRVYLRKKEQKKRNREMMKSKAKDEKQLKEWGVGQLMRRFYLAARYSRREELLGVREFIEAIGGDVTSRWLRGNHYTDDEGTPVDEDGHALTNEPATAASMRERFAAENLLDIRMCDTIVVFTESPRSTRTRGGRHVELGIALGFNKHIMVVGPRENIFCWLPEIEYYPYWSEAALSVCRWIKHDALP